MERFASVDKNERQRILDEKESPCTQKSNQVSFGVLEKYCAEKKLNFDPTSVTKCEMDQILNSFYVEARKEDGSMYKKTSFSSLRFGIQRHMKKIRDINIIDDPEFQSSNEIFKAQCVQLKKAGLAKIDHKQEITKSDLNLLYSSGVFSTAKPSTLQRKVFFEVILYLCRRGRQNLRNLSTDSFEVKKFPDGKRYVVLVKDELTKNNRVNDEYREGGMIVETGEENCPVASFLFYVDKLNPKLKVFFQRPKESPTLSGPWFDNQVLGQKSIDKMMKNISKEAKLSQIYTNHCIRATCITLLDSAGVEARHIMSISGHKSEASLRSYAKTNASIKRKMASTISSVATCSKIVKKSIHSVDIPLVRNFDFGLNISLSDEDENKENELNVVLAREVLHQENKSFNVVTRDEKPSTSNNTNGPILSSLFHYNKGEIHFSNCSFNY